MSAEPTWSYEWIDSAQALEEACTPLCDEEILSVDTETDGWQTGNERLCLIQIGIPSQEHTLIIDALALDTLEPLAPIIEGDSPELVAHNAQFEARQFARHDLKMDGELDTLEMVRYLRPDLPNHKLGTCCRILLDIDLSKEEQTSDWSVRPLSESQLEYARLDAEVAMQLFDVLSEIEQEAEIDPSLSVEQMMKELFVAQRDRYHLLSEISDELAVFDAKISELEEAIRGRLEGGESSYEGQWGKCKLSRVKRTEVSPALVRNELPELAEQLICEKVDKKQLRAALKEHGIDKSKIDEVSEVIGYSERFNLKSKEWA